MNIIGAKIPEQKVKSKCSPAAAPSGVSTRRSSMSPRIAESTPVQQHSKTPSDEKPNTSTKDPGKTDLPAAGEDKTLKNDAKGNFL